MKRSPRRSIPAWLLVILLTGAAAALRLAALDHLPPGLYRDEAYNGLDALSVLAGQRPLFFTANNGREPLFIYLAAAAVAAWGRSPGALRLVLALAGTLTVPAIYWLGRELYGRRVWSAGGRPGGHGGVDPELEPGGLAGVAAHAPAGDGPGPGLAGRPAAPALAHGLGRRVLRPLVLYLPGGALYAPWPWGCSPFTCGRGRAGRAWWRGLGLFVAAAAVTAAPLGFYFAHPLARHPGPRRPGIDPEPGHQRRPSLADPGAARRAHPAGLLVPRRFHPPPQRALAPVFDPWTGAAFLARLGLAGWRVFGRGPASGGKPGAAMDGGRLADALALIWLAVMMLPTILAEDAPHFFARRGHPAAVVLFPGPRPGRRLGLAGPPRPALDGDSRPGRGAALWRRGTVCWPTPGTCTARRSITNSRPAPRNWQPLSIVS